MKRSAAALAVFAVACSGRYSAPPAVASIALPSGADLKPWDAAQPGLSRPSGMALYNGNAYVALGNYDASYTYRGPGLLLATVPSTGATTLIDLGGAAEKQCINPGFVRQSGSHLYVSCTGDYMGDGQAIVEVDPASNKVTRIVSTAIAPYGAAATSSRIWFGDAGSGNIYAVDLNSFTVTAGPLPVTCPSTGTYTSINDLQIVGSDLFVACSNGSGGVLNRVDAGTGAVKDTVDAGPIAVEFAETGDGRIAIVSGADDGLRLVTLGSTMTVTAYHPFSNQTSTLQDVRARDNYLFTTASGSNTVQKIDLNASGGPAVIDEDNVGSGASPWNILPLDDSQALVSNQSANTLVSVKWSK